MQVILLERVDKQGEEGDIVDVSSGYARNYLIPNGLAKPATEKNIQEIKQKKKQKQKQENKQKQQAQEKHSKLDGATINLQKPANEDGKLYASVGEDDVISAIKEFCGEDI
ncbi:MAG: 50S ribosomal protein L9, partial [Candidatus Paceibacteria bacterium]